MKKLIILLLFFLIFVNLKADEKMKLEIGINVINGQPNSFPITFTLDAQGIIWDEDHEITTSYSSADAVVEDNGYPVWEYGWAACWEELEDYEEYAYTLYKLSSDESSTCIYLDLRDCNYPGMGYSPDFRFEYNAAYNEFSYSGTSSTWTDLENGELITVWKINHNNDPPDIECFIPDVTNFDLTLSNGHPKLTWNHERDPNGIYKYEIWRLINSSHVPYGTFSLLTTLNNPSTLEYIDIEVSSGTALWAHYKIRAKIDDLKSGFSGIESTRIDDSMQKPIVRNETSEIITEFKLFNNYPNPFNNTTKISFDLPQESFVNLTVYNINGETVSTLVYKTLEAGNYNILFYAENLPSGFYFYKINAGSFSHINRMLLIK